MHMYVYNVYKKINLGFVHLQVVCQGSADASAVCTRPADWALTLEQNEYLSSHH